MKKAIFALFISLLFSFNLFSLSFADMSSEAFLTEKEKYVQEIIELNESLRHYKKKAEELQMQKEAIEIKFSQMMAERDIFYKNNLARKVETDILNERMKKIEAIYEKRLKHQEMQYQNNNDNFEEIKKAWLGELREGDYLQNSKNTRVKQRKDLEYTKKRLKNVIEQYKKYEEFSKEIETYLKEENSILTRKNLYKEEMINAFEDYLEAKNKMLNDAKDAYVFNEIENANNKLAEKK